MLNDLKQTSNVRCIENCIKCIANLCWVVRFVRHQCLPLLYTKAFDFNWASGRENARAEFQISGKIKFPRIAEATPATHRVYIYPDGVSGTTRDLKSSECTYVYLQESCIRDQRRIATRALYIMHLVFFYF